MALLEFQNVSKSYDNVTKALSDITFSIEKGEFVSIIGPSGAGKSTLLRCINRLVDASEGTIIFDGHDVRKAGKAEMRQMRAKIGMIFQHYNLVERLSVIENVLHGCLGKKSAISGMAGHYTEEEKKEAFRIIQEMGLSDQVYKRCDELSGGQKQRVAIAGIMAMEPECIVLDEPTAMLDPEGRRHVLSLVKALNKEKNITILMVTHHMEEVILADRIIVMDQGKIVMDGKPKEIFSRVDEMKTLGLEVPYATELAWELKKEGVNLSDTITTKEELVEELCQFV